MLLCYILKMIKIFLLNVNLTMIKTKIKELSIVAHVFNFSTWERLKSQVCTITSGMIFLFDWKLYICSLASFCTKSLDCLPRSFTPTPGISSLPWDLSQSKLHL